LPPLSVLSTLSLHDALPISLREYLSRIPALLGRDPNLAWFLAARGFAVVGSIGGGFYTVYALRAWDAPVAQVGVFTTLLFVGQRSEEHTSELQSPDHLVCRL